MNDLIYIILINYNGFEDTCECLESIISSEYENYKVLIIDNNSPDGSGKMIMDKFPQFDYILSEENMGFAKANNIGFKYAIKNKAEYILLLNNDTIIDSQMILHLIDKADENTITVPKMYYYDNRSTIWFAGGEILKNRGTVKHIGIGKLDSKFYCKEKYISFATGCCMLIHKDILSKINLFDEKYFMYCEDFDFCIRLNSYSFKLLFCPHSKLWHKVNSSTKNNSNISKYYLTRNRFYTLNKNRSYFSLNSILYSYASRMILVLKDLFSGKDYKIYLQAWKDYKVDRMGRKDF